MAKRELQSPRVIPKFSSEAAEAEWWDVHRAEVEVRIRAKLLSLAERTAADINERAARMTPEKRARADSETRKIADLVAARHLF